MQQSADEKADRRVRNLVSERTRTGASTATMERALQVGEDGFEITPSSKINPRGTMRIVAAPLDRLWKEGKVTQREFEAGDKYRADSYLAAVDPGAGTVDWARAGGGGTSNRVPMMFTAQHIADARIRFREVEQAIPPRSTVATLLYLALIKEQPLAEIGRNTFGRADRKEATVAGMAGVRTALAALADHYGL